MKIKASSIEEYLENIPEDRKAPMSKLREIVAKNIPEGFQEQLTYGMPGYVVPHSIFPDGYHCTPELPLPFLSFASQKNFIAFYHSGIYASPELLNWFKEEYPKHVKTKLDMGKSCIRFKNMKTIPYDLIGELCTKMTCEEWIETYKTVLRKK
ncbi:MAG: DUF1801 domain-containing protein [Flavobacteriales bacterium]